MNTLDTKKINKLFLLAIWIGLLCVPALEALEEKAESTVESGHTIHFQDIPVIEFIRFVSKISHVNFIFDNQDLQFNITFSTGKAVSEESILKALIQMLRVRGFGVSEEETYYVIHRDPSGESSHQGGDQKTSAKSWQAKRSKEPLEFLVHKLQYHQGNEIEEAIKKIAADLRSHPDTPLKLLNAIQSMQWVKATNSILCSGDEETLSGLKKLIESLDIPLKQVFIEVLVIETDVRKSMDFGLEWAAGGQYQNKVGFGVGNFPPKHSNGFARTLQGINASSPPTGLGQIPIGNAFDIGVIGDLIMHKGMSYLTLGALASALQTDGDSIIVLNQKIITQDNKNSKIFVGDNLPFTGSVVQTVGQSQQTTSNIEYRDIGVSLSITPMLGEGDIITLDLDEEISQALSDNQSSHDAVNGIRTTKTNMVTHVHVPDKHFLVLSGMIRNVNANHKTGVPCLGGAPLIGALFSKTRRHDEKRNVIIFVRPHIIRTFDDYKKVTQNQEELYKEQSLPADFEKGINLLDHSLSKR